MPHSTGRAKVSDRNRLLFAVLTALVHGSLGCVTLPKEEIERGLAEMTGCVVLNGDRFAYRRSSWATSATTKPRMLGRGIPDHNHGWADLKDEIRRLSGSGNANALLIIYPATEQEKHLKMIVDECKEVGLRYDVTPPSRDVLEEVVKWYRGERRATTAPASSR